MRIAKRWFAEISTTGSGILRVAVTTALQCNTKFRIEKNWFKPLYQGKLLFSKPLEGEKSVKNVSFSGSLYKAFYKTNMNV